MTERRRAIVVTGATGFVGAALVESLRARGLPVQPWSRAAGFDLEQPARWREQLRDVDVVVHCAARVHQLHDRGDELTLYRRLNTEATVELAAAAASAGVRRFVFLSTAKVYGEGALVAYSEATPPAPQGAYAQSKWEAEQALMALARERGFELVILRPPLVYGAGVGGNFEALWRLAGSRWPLPLAALRNRRDMVALDNLVEVIVRCCSEIAAAGHTFNVADAQAYSLPQILTVLRAARGRAAGLWWLPRPLLQLALMLLRGRGDAQRLLGEFRVETQTVRRVLRWQPAIDMATVAAVQRESGAC